MLQIEYAPLGIDLIDQGELVKEIGVEFGEHQAELIRYIKKHGDQAVGAKAKFTIEITLSVEEPVEDGQIGIVSKIKRAMPERPPTTSRAITGETGLFVQATGSSPVSARQGVLSTQDGRTVVDPPDEGGKTKKK